MDHRSKADVVRVGGPAPPLAIRTADQRLAALPDFAGQPVVLAFLDRWRPPGTAAGARNSSPELEAVRAELRGLGAVLLALSDGGLWCFRPDDEAQLCARADEIEAGDLEAVRARYGVPAGAAGLFVIDGDGRLRFAHVAGAEAGAAAATAPATFETVADALGAAGRALTAPRPSRWLPSRREMVVGSLVAAFSLALLDGCASRHAAPGAASPLEARGGDLEITLNVNGTPRVVRIEPRVTLLDALRERLGLTGSKKGCDQGQCGACTVLVGGRRVNACLTLAIMVQGAPVTTIEGMMRGERLHPLQAAFVAEDGLQCGYCTAGQIMSAAGMLAEGHARSDDEVREQMSGNICRCGAYPNIVAAIQRARKEV